MIRRTHAVAALLMAAALAAGPAAAQDVPPTSPKDTTKQAVPDSVPVAATDTVTAAAKDTATVAGPAAREDTALKRWDVTVDFGVNGSKGNTSLTVLSTGVGIKHLITEEFRLEWTGTVRYGESEGDVVARNLRTQVGVDLYPQATLSPFLYADFERDPFRRMRFRTDGGAGAKYTFWRSGAQEFSVSVAGLYSRQDFLPTASGDLTPRRMDARLSARARFRRNLGDARIEHTSFYRPVYNHLDDYTYDANTRLSTKLTEFISFAVTYLFKHNTTPPQGVGREDQSFQAGITVQF